jgi:MFS family permease
LDSEHDAYAALRHPGYRCLLSGAVLSGLGAEVQAVAVSWELYDRTGSALTLAYAGLAQFLPVLLLALPAGAAADRFSRKRLFQTAQATSAGVSILLAYLSVTNGPVVLFLLCLLIAGVARAFSAPARQSFLAQVVPLADLPNAAAWNSTGWQIANIAGPALGGLVVARAPPATAYAFAGCGALVCVLLLVPIRPFVVERTAGARSLSALLDGVRFVWRTKPLLSAITLDLFAVLLGGATALLPIFAKDILQVGADGLGWLRAAPAVGALLTALTLAHLPPLRRPGVAMLLAVIGFGVVTIVFGLSRSYPLSFGMLVLLGGFDNISVVIRSTLMQLLTPDEMRGRVAAVNTVFISSSNELGAFESGVAADWFGPIAAVVGGGVGTIVVVLVVLASFPVLLRLGPLHTLLVTPPTPPQTHEPGTSQPL